MASKYWIQNGYKTEQDLIVYIRGFQTIDRHGTRIGFHYAPGPCTGFEIGEILPRRLITNTFDFRKLINKTFNVCWFQSTREPIVIISGLSHLPFLMMHIKLLLVDHIEYHHDFQDFRVTRSMTRYAAEASEPFFARLFSIDYVFELMRTTYVSTSTGFFFMPNAGYVCHQCGYNTQIPSGTVFWCPECRAPSLPHGHLIVHDREIAETFIHVAGGKDKCTNMSEESFLTLAISILEYDEFCCNM